MSRLREYFEITNNNLNNKNNLSGCMQQGILLAESLGKGQIAYSEISQLPPSNSFNNPDYRLDAVIAFSNQQMTKENNITLGITR